MVAALKKYKVLLNSGKWNARPPEQEKMFTMTTVVENLEYYYLKLAKDSRKTTRKGKGKRPQLGNINDKGDRRGGEIGK